MWNAIVAFCVVYKDKRAAGNGRRHAAIYSRPVFHALSPFFSFSSSSSSSSSSFFFFFFSPHFSYFHFFFSFPFSSFPLLPSIPPPPSLLPTLPPPPSSSSPSSFFFSLFFFLLSSSYYTSLLLVATSHCDTFDVTLANTALIILILHLPLFLIMLIRSIVISFKFHW